MGFFKRLLGLEAPSEQEIYECLIDNSNRCFSNKNYYTGGYVSITSDSTALDKKREAEMDASVRRALINAGVDFTIVDEKEKTKEYYDKIQKATLQRQTEEKMEKEKEIKELQDLLDSSKNAVDALVNGKF